MRRTNCPVVVWRGVALPRPSRLLHNRHPAPPRAPRPGPQIRAQCLLPDYLFSTTLANRVDAGTEAENIAEQRALEQAGFQREGLHRGRGFREGRMVDGLTYARLRSGPHP